MNLPHEKAVVGLCIAIIGASILIMLREIEDVGTCIFAGGLNLKIHIWDFDCTEDNFQC